MDVSDGLYLGDEFAPEAKGARTGRFLLPTKDLLTHLVILGTTGSGKTVLGKALIEEAARSGIPSILVDLKGDLSSLKCTLEDLSARSFLPWVKAGTRTPPQKKSEEFSALYTKRFEEFGLSEEFLSSFHERANVVILTPRSSRGVPLAISALPSAPSDIGELFDLEPETALDLIDTVTKSLVSRLYPGDPPERHRVEEKFLNEIVAHAWKNEIGLEGRDGLAKLVEMVESPPIRRIGVLELEKYISERDRRDLAININNLLVGAEQLWETGLPLDIEYLLELFSMEGRTPVIVVNLNEISNLEDRMFVVSRLSYAIYQWMRKQGGDDAPKLVYYIDEIGGGGGRHAFLPSHPYYPSSKAPLTLLVKQGRAFGVCCVLSTQNPGDIDYKALSNCGTWIVGKLPTSRDRGKVFEGLGDAEVLSVDLNRSRLERIVSSLQTGEFLVKTKRGSLHRIRERWLTTFHKTLTSTEIGELTDDRLRQLALSDRTLLLASKRRFLKVRHPPERKELDRLVLGVDEFSVEDPSIEYKPLLHASGRLRFKAADPRLDDSIELSLEYGPFLVPLDAEHSSPSYASEILGFTSIPRVVAALREDPEEDIPISGRTLTVGDAFDQIQSDLRPRIMEDLTRQISDLVSAELERKRNEVTQRNEPEQEDLRFKIDEIENNLKYLRQESKNLEREIENLRSELKMREKEKRPTLQVTKSINSRKRKLRSAENKISSEERTRETLSSRIDELERRVEEELEALREEYGEIASTLLEDPRLELEWVEAEEIDVPISSFVISREGEDALMVQWNAWNSRRITPVLCRFCESVVELDDPFGLCYVCGSAGCQEHLAWCSDCGRLVCPDDAWTCSCGRIHCVNEESKECAEGGELLCSECTLLCESCGNPLCEKHISKCENCGRSVCSECRVERKRFLVFKKRMCELCAD